MGRWATFFMFIFVISSILTAGLEGGGFAATHLTADVGANDVTVSVVSTEGFLRASVAHPAYVQCGNEVFSYTGSGDTSFTGVMRGQSHPQTGGATEAEAHSEGTTVKTLSITTVDKMIGYNVTTAGASFGFVDALTLGGHMIGSMISMAMWDYPWLRGQGTVFRYILFAFSWGFIVSFGIAMLGLGMSLWRS